jgi:uncharacterized membrane protein
MEKNKSNSSNIPAFEKINSFQRLFICIAIAVIIYFVVEIKNIDTLSHIMISWDVFSLCMIVMSWITFFITKSQHIREQAKVQDSSRSLVFCSVLICTLASFVAVLILLVTKKESNNGASWRLPIAIGGMLFSWFLIHTIFALKYAHMFYGNHETKKDSHAGGLEFPNDDRPEYLDFAYFSFVLGMTFQVSDVQITSKKVRNTAMLHGLLSFGFNTIMIALTINMIASFGSS